MATRTLLITILFILVACTGQTAAPVAPAMPTAAPLAYVHKIPFGVIKVLENPATVPADGAAGHIMPNDLIMGMEINGESRAYPIGLMRRYEIANDVLGGEPIAVTFCPSCNTGLAFSRIVNGAELIFDFSGMTLDEAMVMVDRTTHSYWSQVRLQAVEGEMAGQRLELLASNQMTWAEWVAQYPETTLIVDPRAPQKENPLGLPVFPGSTVAPDAYHGYVAGIVHGDSATAYPLDEVQELGVVNGNAAGLELLLVGLDEPGEVVVWQRSVEGRTLTFTLRDGVLSDTETGTVWNAETGAAETGPLDGAQLAPVEAWMVDWRGWQDAYPQSGLELVRS